MKVLAFINQKGGVGKTTSCVNIGSALSLLGKKVLLIDLDPQASLTKYFGWKEKDIPEEKSTYNVLTGATPIKKAVLRASGMDIVTTDMSLAGADQQFSKKINALKKALDKVKDDYDYALIDCNPAISFYSFMAMFASDGIIIPVQAQYMALSGLIEMIDILDQTASRLGTKMKIGGIIITMYDGRRNIDRDVAPAIRERFPAETFKSNVKYNSKLPEAPGFHETIFEYAPKSPGAEAYMDIAKEILDRDL